MNQIHYSVENGNHVFRKKRDSTEEQLFYNKEYFAMIGFPDAEITIEMNVGDSIMKGGRYYDPEKVTVPFRQFVYLVQGKRSENGFSFFNRTSSETKPEPEHEPEQNTEIRSDKYESSKGIISKFGEYMKTGISRFSDIIKTNSNKTSEEKPIIVADKAVEKTLIKMDIEPKSEPKLEPQPESIKQEVEYWVIKIPFVKNENIEPKGKCEMEEVKLMQTILQKKAQRSISIPIEYEYRTIDERVIMLCKRVKNKDEPVDNIEFDGCLLKGSVMDKYNRKTVIV